MFCLKCYCEKFVEKAEKKFPSKRTFLLQPLLEMINLRKIYGPLHHEIASNDVCYLKTRRKKQTLTHLET